MTTRAERFAARQAARHDDLVARLTRFVATTGNERALDVGTGTGALAFALAARVREVVAVDVDRELLDRARADAPANVEVREADAQHLPFGDFEFDLVATQKTLHHVPRAELALAEIARVARPGATILVVDQIAPADPLAAAELNAFERAREPETSRILSDTDLRSLFDANGLVLRRAEFVNETRELESYLDHAGCEGEARERARALAPRDYAAIVGWYVLRKP